MGFFELGGGFCRFFMSWFFFYLSLSASYEEKDILFFGSSVARG